MPSVTHSPSCAISATRQALCTSLTTVCSAVTGLTQEHWRQTKGPQSRKHNVPAQPYAVVALLLEVSSKLCGRACEQSQAWQKQAPDDPAEMCQPGIGVANAVGLSKFCQQPLPGPGYLQALRPALLRFQRCLQHQVIYLLQVYG